MTEQGNIRPKPRAYSASSQKSRGFKNATISGGTGAAVSGIALNLPESRLKSFLIVSSPILTVIIAVLESLASEAFRNYLEDRNLVKLTDRAKRNLANVQAQNPVNEILLTAAKRALEDCHLKETQIINERLSKRT